MTEADPRPTSFPHSYALIGCPPEVRDVVDQMLAMSEAARADFLAGLPPDEARTLAGVLDTARLVEIRYVPTRAG